MKSPVTKWSNGLKLWLGLLGITVVVVFVVWVDAASLSESEKIAISKQHVATKFPNCDLLDGKTILGDRRPDVQIRVQCGENIHTVYTWCGFDDCSLEPR